MTSPARPAPPLPAWSLFAAMIAAAGLPIYIHAPKVYADSYGVDLAALGAVLAGLRLLDVVQDPALGWLAGRLRRGRGLAVAVAVAILAGSMLALFAVPPPVAPLLWFALALTGLFSAFSFLTICFYAEGVAAAEAMGPGGHTRLATWRETGALLGVCVAAVAPAVLAMQAGAPLAAFAWGFAAVALAAAVAMRRAWGRGRVPASGGFGAVLSDAIARRLLLIALLNAAPVAVTSTLFLFFVDSRLGAAGWEGPLLLVFFLSAAVAAPAWGALALRIGARRALLAGMALAIATFGWAATLGAGDVAAFAVICMLSGAALGADLTLLPAIFARRMAVVAPEAAAGFGLWSFASKASLAIAAGTLLPLLDRAGFVPGAPAGENALWTLGLAYAVLPCVLKIAAIVLLGATTLPDEGRGADERARRENA